MPLRGGSRQVTFLRQCGYTLVELSVVAIILGILAAAIFPSFRPVESRRIDVAASEFADALRFARSEALRLRQPIGFSQDAVSGRLRLFTPDTSGSPWILNYDIPHPISKQPYDIRLSDHPFAGADGVTVTEVFRGTCNLPGSAYFDDQGVARCVDPTNVLLDSLEFSLVLGEQQRVVVLETLSGQVRIQ